MIDPNFHPFPVLETERLLLRSLSEEDAPDILFLRSDARILTYLLKEPATTLKEARDFINQVNAGIDANDAILWGIALKENPGRIIGTICIWQIKKEDHCAEIGYVLDPGHWKKGLMKEAITEVLHFGFNRIGLNRMEGNIAPENLASAASLESVGFKKEAHLRENILFKGKFLDSVVYGLLKKEWTPGNQ